jgi:hypothetical protein
MEDMGTRMEAINPIMATRMEVEEVATTATPTAAAEDTAIRTRAVTVTAINLKINYFLESSKLRALFFLFVLKRTTRNPQGFR